MDVDFDSICRLCASKDGFKINLFEEKLGYIDKITRFIPLKISEDDKLPSKICFRCAMLITDFEKFCTNCIEVQETLLKRNNNQKESQSEEILDPEAKSNNTMQDKNIPDDYDDDHAYEVDSNDDDSECSEMSTSNCESDQIDTNRKVSKKLFKKHSPSENENPSVRTSVTDEGKPSHLKETQVPLPGSSKSSQTIYTCEYCTQMFITKSIAYSHVCPNLLNNCKRDEIIEPNNSYTCELCYQVFSRQAVLQAHRIGHMNNSSGEESGDEIYDENVCVFGQKKKKKRRGNRVARDGLSFKPFFQNDEQEEEAEEEKGEEGEHS
ncbi:hypothetical protein LSTR_LSTR001704 [Laodelphax striatellus]|uniref:Uncharacterized protein n=1 Tax=Laodelphax striatellus TaxID=195883 RepID=A0A482XCL9_LAOST|nr:hypothetical protein LSTR_LSTR001704 [Laodelphax striatellus]